MTSSCSHFPTCGGCLHQDKTESAYRDIKHDALQRLFKGPLLEGVEILPALLSRPHTRRRARLAALSTKKGVILGYNQRRSHTLIDLHDCAVLLPELVEVIGRLRPYLKNWLESAKDKKGDVQLTRIAKGYDLVLIGGALPLSVREDCMAIAQDLGIDQISWRKWDHSDIEPVVHRAPLVRKYGDIAVPFPPGSFLQATEEGEEALVSFARRAAKGGKKFLDLFSGLGGFGLSMGEAEHVTFADWDGPAIAALSKSVQSNPRYSVMKRDLAKDPLTSEECASYDVILFDPPRGGAKKQAQEIASSNVKKVIAISCDPESFVRDASILMTQGYKIGPVQPVDQFLWSSHVEVMAVFEKALR